MIEEIAEFLFGFKNNIVEADILVSKYSKEINSFAKRVIDEGLHKEYEENFLTILGYSFRLDDIKQRLFFTFQEAVYAIDLDKLMKNQDSLRLNSIVYILVLNTLIEEYKSGKTNEELKQKALEVYKKIEDKRLKENQKYHIYQY